MAFDEPLKLRIRRRAHFACCMCHEVYVEIHHIIPEAEGGPDTEDNAAPLCPTCHEKFGANPTKRKFIREMRDHWYELCDTRYKSVDASQLERISGQLANAATKQDVATAFQQLAALVQAGIAAPGVSLGSARQLVAHVTSSVATSVATLPVFANVDLGGVFRVAGTGHSSPGGHMAESKADVLWRDTDKK